MQYQNLKQYQSFSTKVGIYCKISETQAIALISNYYCNVGDYIKFDPHYETVPFYFEEKEHDELENID